MLGRIALGGIAVKITRSLLLALLLPFALFAQAKEEEKEGEAAKPAAAYVTLFPALVGNFGPGPRLQYYKADIALRVSGSEAETKVAYHEPLIRNQLIEYYVNKEFSKSVAKKQQPKTVVQIRQKKSKKVDTKPNWSYTTHMLN